jgi:hypothetical protein
MAHISPAHFLRLPDGNGMQFLEDFPGSAQFGIRCLMSKVERYGVTQGYRSRVADPNRRGAEEGIEK